MDKIVDKTINWDPTGTDGNAFIIMGNFQTYARRQGWTMQEIDLVLTEARSGDYDHLLATIVNHCDTEEPEMGIGELQEDDDDYYDSDDY